MPYRHMLSAREHDKSKLLSSCNGHVTRVVNRSIDKPYDSTECSTEGTTLGSEEAHHNRVEDNQSQWKKVSVSFCGDAVVFVLYRRVPFRTARRWVVRVLFVFRLFSFHFFLQQ